MSSRNRQQQTQQQSFNNVNTYGWQTPPGSSDIDAMRGFQFQADPRVASTFARARQNIGATYDNPLGGNTNPAIRDAAMRAQYEDLGQREAQAFSEENYARQGLDYARLADVAAMTQPRMVQTSASGSSAGTSNTTQSQGMLGNVIQGGSAIGSALIM